MKTWEDVVDEAFRRTWWLYSARKSRWELTNEEAKSVEHAIETALDDEMARVDSVITSEVLVYLAMAELARKGEL